MTTKSAIAFKVGHNKAKLQHWETPTKWEIFLEIHEKYDVERVEFRSYGSLLHNPLCTSKDPVFLVRSSGSRLARYYYKGYQHPKKQDTESVVVLKVILQSGAVTESWHQVDLQGTEHRERVKTLVVPRLHWTKRLSVSPLPSKCTFGVELELSEAHGASQHGIAHISKKKTGCGVKVVEAYRDAHTPVPTWKLVQDGSIQCHRNNPGCSKFELVSPILRGEQGLMDCRNILLALQHSHKAAIVVNKSMGFHVHVSVEGFALAELKKVCLNFVKYEDAMDLFMPPSRRTGSSCSDRYFKSCKANIRNQSGTIAKLNGGRHKVIMNCKTIKELCHVMNPDGRYYKLNLQNLVTRKQSTVEFRQHSATASAEKVLAWVRFCVTFVRNSANFGIPEYLKNTLEAEEAFDHLFSDLIRCATLESYFTDRVESLAEVGQRKACCSGCAHGNACDARGY